MSQKSLALVLSGQPRFAIDSVQRQISLLKQNYNVSIFFHTWDENSSSIKSTAAGITSLIYIYLYFIIHLTVAFPL